MRRKRKAFWKPVTAGFGAVYLLTMALATFLVKTKFAEDFTQRLGQPGEETGPLSVSCQRSLLEGK